MATALPEDLIFVGDVHLGRRPVGLDAALEREGLSPEALSPAAALARLVDHLLGGTPPRAVVFAGDLVDQENDRFEALAVLEREVGRLTAAGIPVLAVAGNHDCLVLPRLVELVPDVHLVGAGGTWERVELAGPGPAVDLIGWSFPTSHVHACPLDQGGFEAALAGARPGALGLGVLHGDLDATGSPYGPVPRRRLEAAGLDGWFLGHVHAPADLTVRPPLGYLGSLVGLKPTETGPRGAWRVTPGTGGVTARQLHLGPIRWESLTVTLDGSPDPYAVRAALEAALARRFGGDGTLADHDLVVARVELAGELEDRAGVATFLADHADEQLTFDVGGLTVAVQRVTDATRQPVDLEALAQEPTPVGRLAGHLLDLRAGRAGELLERTAATTARVDAGGWDLDPEDHPLPAPEDLLERAAWRVLDALLAQREEATP